MRIALITDVFPDGTHHQRLRSYLQRAALRGADLAVLPELPLNPWSPLTPRPRPEDAEPPGGDRQRLLARYAEETGVAILGGVILQDPDSGLRYNTALLYDGRGHRLHAYRKAHVPEEAGFYEASHYAPGDDLPLPVEGFALSLGVLICSDVQRPTLAHALAASGAGCLLAPRATPAASYPKWKRVLQVSAVTGAMYVISTNRPSRFDDGVAGGPTLVLDPSGDVLEETEEGLSVVTLEPEAVEKARRMYPGYLAHRPDLYARLWERVASKR